MDLEKPTYTTVQPEGLLPIFVSSLVFNGVSYTGDAGRNKKEAEQLAARTVILSILGNNFSLIYLSVILFLTTYQIYTESLHGWICMQLYMCSCVCATAPL